MKMVANISFSFALFLLVPFVSISQLQKHTFEQVDSLQKIEKRNSVIFIYTDWCKFCHAMEQTALQHEEIVRSLNSNFWFVAFNAEENKPIKFNSHTFKFNSNGYNTGTHELAEQLATFNGKASFPTLCILNDTYEIIFQYDQFMTAEELITVLNQVLISQE